MSATIIELQVENVKRLKAIQIVPKGSTVVISGNNDQGKSSALDAIDYAFRGEKAICDEPIRQGEKRAQIDIKLSEELDGVCTIKRTFTAGGTVLEIRNKDGVPQKTPQALLDTIIAKISFDPLSFTRMSSRDQLELLRKLVGLDFTELNAARQLAYEERTIRKREADAARAKLDGSNFNPNLPTEPVSVTELAEKLGAVTARNATVQQRKDSLASKRKARQGLSDDAFQLRRDIEALEKEIQSKRAQGMAKDKAIAAADTEIEALQSEFSALQLADETKLRAEIAAIQQTNADIESNKRYLKARDELELLEGSVRGLSAKITECDEQKAAQIEFAQFPMDGLSFDEERGVLLNGVPFQQGSQARQLQAAVAIGLALNPRVRVIIIRDGSLLDDKSLKMISEMAEANAAQLWIEVVNSKDPQAIVIEDGCVK